MADNDAPSGEDNPTASNPAEVSPITFAEFLETIPPGTRMTVDVVRKMPHDNSRCADIVAPDLFLHCPSDVCNGSRFFRFEDGNRNIGLGVDHRRTFLTFVCSNCQKSRKTFALGISVPRDENS